jgi:DNA-binding NarL/FixJ family response regulator
MLQRLRRDYHFVDIVVTGVSPQSDVLFPILRAGVGGLLSKKDSVFRFVDALRLVAGGGTPLSDDLTKLIFQDYQINLSSPMTRRETEVLTMMAEGKTYSQVAHELNIANETSKKHIRSIYQKLNVASRSEAISKARSEKWIRLV